jgi:hypothetical protein
MFVTVVVMIFEPELFGVADFRWKKTDWASKR